MFFSIGKIFWLLVIIWGVWTAFRIIEKRQKKAAAKAADTANASENAAENGTENGKENGKENTGAGSVDMVECPTCNSWVDPAGCHHPQCGLK